MIERSAILGGPNNCYRYRLERWWNRQQPPMVFIMLNPSTADAEKDDATIRVCMSRAQQNNCGGIVVVNLFAYRATAPENMKCARDPIGPENDKHIAEAISARDARVVAAWGVHGRFAYRHAEVIKLAAESGNTLHAIALTKDGDPRHPLRLPYAKQLEVWRAAR